MATVWAARVGEQQEGVYSTGWSHTIKFDGLIDLNASLAQKRLQGKVTRLGVLAHGDAPGVVQLDRPMHAASLRDFGAELERLRWFLKSDAQVVFYRYRCR